MNLGTDITKSVISKVPTQKNNNNDNMSACILQKIGR